jgi:hypothetical protein
MIMSLGQPSHTNDLLTTSMNGKLGFEPRRCLEASSGLYPFRHVTNTRGFLSGSKRQERKAVTRAQVAYSFATEADLYFVV